MPGDERTAERGRARLLDLLSDGGDDAVRVAVGSLEQDVAYEELRVAVDELVAQEQQLLSLSRQVSAGWTWVERLTAGLPLPVVVTDARGHVVEANARMSTLLAVPLHRLVGKPLVGFVAHEDRQRLAGRWNRLAADEQRQNARVALVDREGAHHAVVLVGIPETREAEPRTRWFVFGEGESGAQAPDDIGLADTVAEIVRLALVRPTADTAAVLRTAASLVTQALRGAAGTTITLGDPAEPALQVSDSAFAQRIDALEVRFDEGPCVEAFRTGTRILSPDAAADPRWPRFAEHAADVQLGGAVALPLVVRDQVVGAVDVYAVAGAEPGDEAGRDAEVLAGAVASLVEVLNEQSELRETTRQLQEALDSRPTIEQAKGILMAHLGCGPDEAFRHLVRHSRRTNVKLRVLAERVVADPSSVAGLL